jgi:hypothetical protein
MRSASTSVAAGMIVTSPISTAQRKRVSERARDRTGDSDAFGVGKRVRRRARLVTQAATMVAARGVVTRPAPTCIR